MPRRKNGYPKPRWLNYVPPKWINSDTKRLYAYLCIFGPDSCDHWNCRLAKKFYVSTRTIARRLRKLRELNLVWTANRQSPYRILHPLYYAKIEDWLVSAQRKKIFGTLAKMGSDRQIPLGQKCPSESEIERTTLSIPSKVRAKKTGPGYSHRGTASPGPPIGSRQKEKSAKNKLYWSWVRYFQSKGYNDSQSAHRAAQQTAQDSTPPS